MVDRTAPQPAVHAFTKPDCSFCARAKAVLDAAGLGYEQHDVTSTTRDADASVYFAGAVTVPQVFLGDRHVESAGDLERLAVSGRLAGLLAGAGGTALPLATTPDDELAAGSTDLPLHTVIPPSDGSRDDDPESWPILHMYKEFFGFWPNTFQYLHHWREAYKLFIYCHNATAIRGGFQAIGMPGTSAAGYATSDAHGCSYCRTHMVVTGGRATLGMGAALDAVRSGTAPADGLAGPFEVAVADLAAAATRNEVSAEHVRRVRELAGQAKAGPVDPTLAVESAAMVVAALGFLNVFNDLTDLDVEGDWAEQAREAGIDLGRHGAGDGNPDNLDYELPSGGPTMEDMLGRYAGIVARAGGPEEYAQAELGLAPAWLRAWPERYRAHHAHLYTELMADREHSLLPAELKHLAARVSAIARDHGYLAAVEGYLAHRAATAAGSDEARAVERVRHCYAAATDQLGDDERRGDDLFDAAERAALRLAWLSAQQPLATPRRFVQPAVDHYEPATLVQLLVACSVASMVQRFVAIAGADTGLEPEPEVERFLAAHGLDADPLEVRYPVRERVPEPDLA